MATKKTATKKAATKKPATEKVPVKAAEPKKAPAKKTTAKKPAAKKTAAKKPSSPKYTPEQVYSMIEQAAYFAAENDGFSKEPATYWAKAESSIKSMIENN